MDINSNMRFQAMFRKNDQKEKKLFKKQIWFYNHIQIETISLFVNISGKNIIAILGLFLVI